MEINLQNTQLSILKIQNSIKFNLSPNRFDVHHACFFTPAIRSRIVQFILDRKRFTKIADDDYAFGIDRLIDEGVYIAAYPLHDVSSYFWYKII